MIQIDLYFIFIIYILVMDHGTILYIVVATELC